MTNTDLVEIETIEPFHRKELLKTHLRTKPSNHMIPSIRYKDFIFRIQSKRHLCRKSRPVGDGFLTKIWCLVYIGMTNLSTYNKVLYWKEWFQRMLIQTKMTFLAQMKYNMQKRGHRCHSPDHGKLITIHFGTFHSMK